MTFSQSIFSSVSVAALLLAGAAAAGPFDSYPSASSPLLGTETLLGGQSGGTVTVTPNQIYTYIINHLSPTIINGAVGYTPVNPASAAITGGTINGTVIGGSTPAAGTFSALAGSVTSTGTTTSRALADRFAEVHNLKDYGAKCDGVIGSTSGTDDTTAINAWLATAAPGVLLTAPAGVCKFTDTISIAGGANTGTKSEWGLTGAGHYATVFQYTGAPTTIDLFKVGSGTLNDANFNYDVGLTNFRLTSTTKMTAGSALHLWHVSKAIVDPIIDGRDGQGNFWDGMHCDECDLVQIPYVDIQGAQHWDLDVNGSRKSEAWWPNYTAEMTLGYGAIGPTNGQVGSNSEPAAGIHIGGGVGGFRCIGVDIIASQVNLLVDTQNAGSGNQSLVFGPGCYFDTSEPGSASFAGNNIVFNDALGPGNSNYMGGNRTFEIDGSVASCDPSGTTQACIDIANWNNGVIFIGANQVDGAAGDAIHYADATTTLTISPNTEILGAGVSGTGYGINSTVTGPLIAFSNPGLFGLASVNASGDLSANVLTSTLPIYTKTYPCAAGNPTLTFGGGSTGQTLSTRGCQWKVQGFDVAMNYQFTVSAVGSSTGNAAIGLPMTSVAHITGGDVAGYATGFSSLTSPISLTTGASSTVANLYEHGSTGVTPLTNSNFTTSSILNGTLHFTRLGSP